MNDHTNENLPKLAHLENNEELSSSIVIQDEAGESICNATIVSHLPKEENLSNSDWKQFLGFFYEESILATDLTNNEMSNSIDTEASILLNEFIKNPNIPLSEYPSEAIHLQGKKDNNEESKESKILFTATTFPRDKEANLHVKVE